MPGRDIQSFEDLECWKLCRRLRIFIANDVVPNLPPEEKYRLADQLLRAARSTTNNIAEGYGRYHYLDNAKFCSNSRGSCWEVLDHLIDAHDEGLVNKDLVEQGRELILAAVKKLNGYIKYLRNAGGGNSVRESPTDYATSENVTSDFHLPDEQHPGDNNANPITNNQ